MSYYLGFDEQTRKWQLFAADWPSYATPDATGYFAQIKWRLEAENGLCAGLDKAYKCALVHPESAQIFDGRDNEQMKRSHYENTLGVKLAIVLL